VRHDMNLPGLGPMFEEFSISLNAQRRNILPHESLGGRSPFSILFPTKTPPLRLFKPFGCHATILKLEVALLKKTQPGGLTGIYIGTALTRGQSGYLIWIPSEKRITTAVHPVFDATNVPACRFSPRIHDLFLLHCHQLTTKCSMIIYLSHITLRHLNIHRFLLSSQTHIPATTNSWNSTLRAMTKNQMITCL